MPTARFILNSVTWNATSVSLVCVAVLCCTAPETACAANCGGLCAGLAPADSHLLGQAAARPSQCRPCPLPATNASESPHRDHAEIGLIRRHLASTTDDRPREGCSNTVASELTSDRRASSADGALMAKLLDLTGNLASRLSTRDGSASLAVFVPSDSGLEAAGYSLGGLFMSSRPQDLYELMKSHIVLDMKSANKDAPSEHRASGFSLEGDKIEITERSSETQGSKLQVSIIPKRQSDASRTYEGEQQIKHTSKKCNGVIYYIAEPMMTHSSMAAQRSEVTKRQMPSPPPTTPAPVQSPQPTMQQDQTPPATAAPDAASLPQQVPMATNDVSVEDIATTPPPQPVDKTGDSDCECYSDSSIGISAPGSIPSGCKEHRPDAYPFCYVTGKTMCSLAQPSASFPGEAWRNCNPEADNLQRTNSNNPCSCTMNQLSGGVQVPGGCGQFLTGSTEYYCYVSGSTDCNYAYSSSNFPGAAWRECQTSDIPDCTCSVDGSSNGIYTGRTGCGLHHDNADAPYCYTTGGAGCPFAEASRAFPGSGWRFC